MTGRVAGCLLIGATTASALIAAVFVPSPWRWVLLVLALVQLVLAFAQHNALRGWQKRVSAGQDHLLSHDPEMITRAKIADHVERKRRDLLIEKHFTRSDDPVVLSCKHCSWHTHDYAARHKIAFEHLADVHGDLFG